MKTNIKDSEKKTTLLDETKPVKSPRRIREDIMRGIPDFVVNNVAETCAETLKRHLVNHINQVSQDATQRRLSSLKVAVLIKQVEDEISELIKEKLTQFIG
jgi:hypothetical protein